MKPPIKDQELARLEALRRYRVLDTAPEQAFDDITKLASFICQTPIAVVSLVDRERQWFKSKVGLQATETPRDMAFCAYTIYEQQLLVVPDATADTRFAMNPLVTSEPNIRFYAGYPLLTPEGHGLGSLCVIDRKPRQLTVEQTQALDCLGRMVVTTLELRRVSQDLATAAANLKTLGGLLPICAYCKNIRNDKGYWEVVEKYVCEHTDAEFTHGICPKCEEKCFAEWDQEKAKAA